jgi:hypothetical protein
MLNPRDIKYRNLKLRVDDFKAAEYTGIAVDAICRLDLAPALIQSFFHPFALKSEELL